MMICAVNIHYVDDDDYVNQYDGECSSVQAPTDFKGHQK